MESVTRVRSAETNQGVTDAEPVSDETESVSESDEFSTLLGSLLTPDAEKNVSEEALFAALTVERVSTLKGDEIGTKYGEALRATQQSMMTNGRIPYEDSARVALKQMIDSGDLTAEEADQIHSQAFAAAQLDTNTSSLFDDYGGANDVTKAVGLVETAIAGAKAMIEKIDAGTETAATRALADAFDSFGNPLVNPYDTGSTEAATSGAYATVGGPGGGTLASGTISPNGTTMDGADGFLFKPVSDGSGKLAVLIPSTYTEWADSVTLKDSSGNVIEDGFWWSGFTREPDTPAGPLRRKFDFSKPGGSYPPDLVVEVKYNSGKTATYSIPNPSQRYD